MRDLIQLRLEAREIFNETLCAINAGEALRRDVRLDGSGLSVCGRLIDVHNKRICSVAIGKAAVPMALALDDIIGEKLEAGLIAGPIVFQPTERKLSARWQLREGGHPLPNENSLIAAQEAFDLLGRANDERALVIFLISGGGSAMIEWPIKDDITLEDLRAANKVLVASGASIIEINAVRRAFSAVKGGRLAARAPNCDQITLIVSDVPKGEERNVASGPTLGPLENAPDPREVIARYDLRSKLPRSIVRAIEKAEPFNEHYDALRQHLVLLDNSDAMEAAAQAARRRGFMAEIANDISDQQIEEGCQQLLKRLDTVRLAHADNCLAAGLVPPVGTSADPKQNSSGVCLISGGEFACPVKGNGIGGRNLETALRLACSTNLSLSDLNFVALCAGTDGVDGNSPAAGGIIDHTTIARAKQIGLDPQDFLDRSDTYSFFVALGDAITTGATGTNVRDLRIVLASH